jgi:hypothetical protein
MKTYKSLTLAVCFFATNLMAQTAGQYLTQGTNALVAHDLMAAYTNFNAAATVSPTNDTANALLAVTRLLVLPQQSAGSNFLNRLGFPAAGRNLYNWTSNLPVDVNGNTILPTNNTSEAVAFFKTNIISALEASRTNLALITNSAFTLTLTAAETDMQDVTVDHGDILLMQAELYAAEFFGYTMNAHNFNFVFNQLKNIGETGGLTVQQALANYPSLLTQNSPADLANSKAAFTNAITLYQQASAFIRSRPPGTVRLFNLDPQQQTGEAEFRTDLTNVLLSLNGPVQITTNSLASLDLGNYFSGVVSLRSLLPQFNGDSYVNGTLPDYTFGGVLLNVPAYLTEAALRKAAYSYAGIYGGQVEDFTFGDPSAGVFGVFVGTNQQVTVVGYDTDSFQHINGAQSGGVAAQFNVDQHGNWQFDSNSLAGVSGYGSFSKDGSLYGELDFTNGDSVWLNGYKQPALGSFQNAAGNYGGTYSMTYQGQQFTGKLLAVLSAAGQLPFCIFDPTGAQNDGGMGQFGSNNKFITTNTTSGAILSGTLNLSTFQITGTATNGPYGGTFTLTRSASVPFDVPPVITTNLPSNLTVPAGTNLTIFVVATGSPPMCYQWYFNGVAIPNATTNTLVLSNLQPGNAGTYSVAINNAVGGTNAAEILSVNLTVSTVSIGSSKLLSNGQFQLTINGGVSGQKYVLLASTDLVNWTPISGFVDTNPPVTIYDPAAANYSRRFYRIGPVSLAPAMKLGLNSGQLFGGGGLNLLLYSLPGFNYEVEASTNLVNWISITNFASTNSPFSFSDPQTPNFKQRFYRAVMP